MPSSRQPAALRHSTHVFAAAPTHVAPSCGRQQTADPAQLLEERHSTHMPRFPSSDVPVRHTVPEGHDVGAQIPPETHTSPRTQPLTAATHVPAEPQISPLEQSELLVHAAPLSTWQAHVPSTQDWDDIEHVPSGHASIGAASVPHTAAHV